MNRVTLDLAAQICTVKPGTIRRWVHDGRLTRHRDGYDFDELIALRDGRDLHALCTRAGIRKQDRPRRVA